MPYSFLSSELVDMADAAEAYLRARRGITRFKYEESIAPETGYRPTLSGTTSDHYIYCVDVVSSIPQPAHDSFILNCVNLGLPVKFYLALNEKDAGQLTLSMKKVLKQKGIGLLLYEGGTTTVRVEHEAVAQSLLGYRKIDLTEFPNKYRSDITDAETIYMDGVPDKGCAKIYDLIEHHSRKLAKKTYDKGYWTQADPSFKTRVNFDTKAWAKIMEMMLANLKLNACGCPKLKMPLLLNVSSLTDHRNQTGHKPSNMNALTKRDRALRTRFEHAIDTLQQLVEVTKPIRLL
jgi:hypothetical protein